MPGQDAERPRNVRQLLDDAWRTVPEITPQRAREWLERGDVGVLLDVREPDEWERGHIPGAVHAPRGLLEWYADPSSPSAKPELTENRAGRVVVYCAAGGRSLLAGQTLQRMGYTDVVSIGGGFDEWSEQGLPVE